MAIHNRRWMAGLLVGMAVLAGCGTPKVPDSVEQTSLIIDAKGGVVSHMVDVFDKSHYNIDELRDMANKEVADYNTANQSGTVVPVTVTSVVPLSRVTL